MKRFLFAVLLMVAGSWGQAAQEPLFQDTPRLESHVRGNIAYLTLQNVIAIALENNLDVELNRLASRLAASDITRARSGSLPRGISFSVREGPKSIPRSSGYFFTSSLEPSLEKSLSIAGDLQMSSGPLPPAFDSFFTGRIGMERLSSPQLNSFMVGTGELVTTSTLADISWHKGFLSGGDLSLDFQNSRQSHNHRRYDLDPFYASSIGITFTQPLLRGFGSDLNSRFIRIASNRRDQSDLIFQQQVISTVSAVVRLYWDLVSLSEDVEVRRQTVEESEKLLRDNNLQVETGTMAPIEVVRARAEVARSRRDLIVAESLARQQELILKDYLTRKTVSDATMATIRISPADTLTVDLEESIPPAAELAETALRLRPDLAQARIQIENSRVALKGSKNQLLPSLDLVTSLRNNSLSGDINSLTLSNVGPHNPDAVFLGGYENALSQLAAFNFPDYSISLQFTVPFGNRAAEEDYAMDRLILNRQELHLQQLRKQVYLEIVNALIALESSCGKLRAAEQEKEFQEEALAAEKEKLTVGASTTYLVIQYQRDLAEARSAEVAARADFAKAKILLFRASGLLLDAYNILVSGSEIEIR